MVALYIDTTTHTVRQTLGLLENFLQHEVGIASLLNLSEVDIYGLHRQLLLFAQNTYHFQFLTQTDNSNVAVLQIDHLVGVFNDRTGITAKEELVVANTNHQRTLLTSCNDLTGVALVNDSNGIGTNHLKEGYLNSLQERQVLFHHDILYQLNQHLGIGIRLEVYSLVYQFCLDVSVVLNNTIVDNGKVV